MNKYLKLLVVSIVLTLLLLLNINNSDLNIHIISDLHYAPKELFSYSSKFKLDTESNGTAKQIEYQEEIFDAYINEELVNKPDYIIITGDLVYSGTKIAHEKFKEKFHRLIENGINVLVVPGNHDFDHIPFYYKDEKKVYSTSLKPEEFIEIYKEFGYDKAFSKDENSLSYSYKLNNSTLLICLDTLSKYGNTNGSLKNSSLEWIEKQLIYANDNNMKVIIVGHHNAMIHNPMFDIGYRLDNSEKLLALMRKYNTKLYISGHMHIQDITNEDDIVEILNEAFTIYPHRYGELTIKRNNYYYCSKTSNISEYINSNDQNLINYDEYGESFFYNNFLNQLLNKIDENELTEEELNTYIDQAIINGEYFAGIIDNNDYSELLKSKNSSKYLKEIINHLRKDRTNYSGTLN